VQAVGHLLATASAADLVVRIRVRPGDVVVAGDEPRGRPPADALGG
jgi:hypothetical protein